MTDAGHEGGLDPAALDQVFQLLETALDADRLTEDQFDRLVTLLRVAVDAASDPAFLAEVLSVLDQLLGSDGVTDPDRLLAVLEAGLEDGEGPELDVIGEWLRDPAAVDEAELDRFGSTVGQAISEFPTVDPPETGRELDGVDPFQVAALVAAVTRRAAGNSVETGLRAGARLAHTAARAESAAELFTAARAVALDELRRAGVDIGDRRSAWLAEHEGVDRRPATRETLERRGARLVAQSAEVGRDESVHPAFEGLLDQLSADEARILRLLAGGPRAVIDIYDRQYLPPKRWRVARNLTSLGRDAGCRSPDRTPVYVGNLRRLGVAEIVPEPVADLERYEVLEAQSHVETARTRAKRPRSEYKRCQLTDLGVEFCELCFPFEVSVDGEGTAVREGAGGER